MVTIRIVSYLKEITGYEERTIKIDNSIQIRELVSFPNIPDNRLVVLVNEKGAKMDNFVKDDDRVVILPVVGGG
ncbi:MAG: MoaD/ThiS family protein [Candidatus Kariarchaeaceae archaeon]|jgi:molybdopterin converting factor small subunit